MHSGHIRSSSGPQKKKTPGKILIQRELAGNVEELLSISDRVAALVMKQRKRQRLKKVKAYVPTTGMVMKKYINLTSTSNPQ